MIKKIHDDRKGLHIVKERSDDRAERRERERYQEHDEYGGNERSPAHRLKTEEERYDKHDHALYGGGGRGAHRSPDHNVGARHGRHERFFQKSELAVPDDLQAGEDGGEDDAHADDAGREIIKIVAAASAERIAEAVTEHDEEYDRLGKQAEQARRGTQIFFDLPEPQIIDLLHICLWYYLLPIMRPMVLV